MSNYGYGVLCRSSAGDVLIDSGLSLGEAARVADHYNGKHYEGMRYYVVTWGDDKQMVLANHPALKPTKPEEVAG